MDATAVGLGIGPWAGLLWLVAGAAAGAGFLRLARRHGPARERWGLGVGLVVAAAIYLVFAAAARDVTGLWIAGVGVVVFAAVAHVGVWLAPVALVLGWGVHVGWDVALHLATPAAPETAPGWYAALCAGFDVVVAAGVARRVGVWQTESTAVEAEEVRR